MAKQISLRVAGVSEILGVDLRSLAAFRVGSALLILADLWYRSRELTAFFTDYGVLPRTARIELYEPSDQFGIAYQWSLHMCNGQVMPQVVLMLVAAMFAVWLLIGYRTRLAALVSWVLLLSLDARNPMILNSGDVLLRCMLFWAMFLPLGARASVDSCLRPATVGLPRRVFSVASVALLAQLGMMYFFSALFKTHEAWTSSATGVYYALNCDAYVTNLGIQLRQFPQLMSTLTVSTYCLELVGPLIVCSPIFHTSIRTALVGIFWSFHLGLALTMTIGLFAPICIVAWLVFLPSGCWDWIAARIGGSRLQHQLLGFQAWLTKIINSGTSQRLLQHAETPYWRQNLLLNTTLAGLLLYIVVWNVRELDVAHWEDRILPRRFNAPARILGLDQNWGMFSPIPRTEDGWLVMRGILREGSEVNLWQPNQTLPWDKPELVSEIYLSQRWRKYLDNLTTDPYGPHRMYFADWLCWRWNRQQAINNPDHEVVEVKLIHRIELTPPPGEPILEPESRVLWTWAYE